MLFCMSMTKSATYSVIRAVLRAEIANNGGFFRPITVIAEPGSILNALPPAASAGRFRGGLSLVRESVTRAEYGAG